MDRNEAILLRRAEEQQHGVFGADDHLSLGLTKDWRDNRLAQGRIVTVYAGVYRTAGTVLTPRGRLMAATLAGGPRGRASHRSAAHLHGFPGGRDDIVEITCPRWRRAHHDGLVVHETKAFHPVDTEVVDGIQCTGVARTLLDLGAVVSPTVVEYALDQALRTGVVTLQQLEALLLRVGRRGRNGAGVLRGLLATRTPGRVAESPQERRMVRQLVACGLPMPVLQYEVRDAHGQFVARVDAAYPQWRIAIEYDSDEFHSGAQADHRDNVRRHALRRIQWDLISVRRRDLERRCLEVARTIRAIRDERCSVSASKSGSS